jgi:hypothetical protein
VTHPDEAPTQRDLAIELGVPIPALSRAARQSQRSGGYGGLRVDEYGYDREGRHYEEYDGGGQGE